MKRRTKILLLLVSALVLALVVGFICLLPHGGYRRAVAAYKKQLLAQGEKLTMVEIAPPPSTIGSNEAIALTNAMKNYQVPSNHPPMMRIIAPGIAMVGHSNPQPAEMTSYGSNVIKAAELRAFLQVAELNFNPDYLKGVEITLSHLSKLKAADTLLAIAATQALHEKNYAGAWSDLKAAVDLIRLFNNEPLMISDMVRFAMARNAVAATWEALQSGHPWSDSQLADLQAKWQGIEFFAHAESVIAMESASEMDALAKVRAGNTNLIEGTTLGNLLAGVSLQGSGNGWLAEFKDKSTELYYRYFGVWLWKSSWSYDEELSHLQITTAAKEATHRIVTTGIFVSAYTGLLVEQTNVIRLHPDADRHFIAFGFAYGNLYPSYLLRLAGAETARRLTVTAIALERFHLQRDAYPASLNELIPAFLPQVPLDFMDGKPLRYQLKPDGNFLLYSVGEDGKDDGGDATPDATYSTDWLRARDIVWPRAATPQELADYLELHPAETNAPAR